MYLFVHFINSLLVITDYNVRDKIKFLGCLKETLGTNDLLKEEKKPMKNEKCSHATELLMILGNTTIEIAILHIPCFKYSNRNIKNVHGISIKIIQISIFHLGILLHYHFQWMWVDCMNSNLSLRDDSAVGTVAPFICKLSLWI